MEIKDMKSLNYKDLLEKLKEAQKKLFELKMQLSNQQLKNYMQIADLRKDIARMNTILTEKRSKGEHAAVVAEEKEVKTEKKEVKKAKKEEKKVKKEAKQKVVKPKKEKVKAKK